jgi:hypothetical protein
MTSAEEAVGPKILRKYFFYFCMEKDLPTPDFYLRYKIDLPYLTTFTAHFYVTTKQYCRRFIEISSLDIY